MPINPQIKSDALKVSEMMVLLSRRLADAANSDDMLVLRRELKEIGDSMQTGGTMLLNGIQNTSFDTSPLRTPPLIQKSQPANPIKSIWNWLIEK